MSDFSIRFEEYENEDVFNVSKKTEGGNQKSEDKITSAVKVIFALLSICILFEFAV